MSVKNYYTLKDVKDLTKCSHRQLQYWEQKGYLLPKLGSRNVRYYRKEDLAVIQQLMDAKKSGKTLGEAWGNNLLSVSSCNPILQSLTLPNLHKISQLSAEWLITNTQFMEQLAMTNELEKNTPGYPYSLYHKEHLEKLHHNNEQIKKTIKKRSSIEVTLRKLLKELHPDKELDLTPEEKMINTLDALILYWAKCRKGDYDKTALAQIRESFTERLQRGESFAEMVLAIKLCATD